MSNPFSQQEKKFSVITPCYKDAYRTFDKFFSALHEQDYKSFEVIVVFDGKNSKGMKELVKMMNKYPEIKVDAYTKAWGGAPAARNYGASKATGDYYTFLDPDVYLYPGTLREWSNAFDENPDKDVIWGLYDLLKDGEQVGTISGIPLNAAGEPDYWAFRFQNYASGANPMRKEAFVGWDETVKSLQDWDMWVRMLKKDNFQGKKFKYMSVYNEGLNGYMGKSYFLTDYPREGGISHDSSDNWLDRLHYVKSKNGIPLSDMCVTSLGAPFHAIHVAKKLGCDFMPMPSMKPHEYNTIYLLGFYPTAASQHGQVFAGSGEKSKKIIHFIGTDIFQLMWKIPFKALDGLRKEWSKKEYELLTEVDYTDKEMKEMGFKTKIVPIPPQKLYEDMPMPEKFTVAVYDNQTQDMYSADLMQDVARAMPDIQFYFFGNDKKKGIKTDNTEQLGWIDLDEWMPKFSCNVRITLHDGLPLTPVQFITAGRTVVFNHPLKGTIKSKATKEDIIRAIREAKKSTQTQGNYWRKKLSFKKYQRRLKWLSR
jgi:hypothetical protein